MSKAKEMIAAMVESLDPEGLKMFATASEDRLEVLKVGFVAYVRDGTGYSDEGNARLFESFVEKAKEAYLRLSVH